MTFRDWLALFDGVKPSGDNFIASCPVAGHAHGDAEQSLSIRRRADGKKTLLKCFVGHTPDEIVAAVGKTVADLFDNGEGDGRDKEPPPTLAELAWDKRLPAEWLAAEFGLREVKEGPRRGVGVPYCDEAHKRMFARVRVALRGKRHTMQPARVPLAAYGLWLLPAAREAKKPLIVVEGESDVWTLHRHGYAAVGCPGSDTARVLTAEALAGFDTLYVWKEPDEGGSVFSAGVYCRLKELEYAGKAMLLDAAAVGAKDPNALHQRDADRFREAFEAALVAAGELPEPGPETPKHETNGHATNGHAANGKRGPKRERIIRVPGVVREGPPEWPGLPAIPPGRFELTDTGNARRLVFLHGKDLRYCHAWKKWLVWDGRRWDVDASGEVRRRLDHTIKAIHAEYEACDDKDQKNEIMRHLARSQDFTRVRGAIELAQALPGIPVAPNDLDADPWLLNVLNGTLDLRTGKLLAHDRGMLQSKMANVSFDEAAECRRWEDFLNRIQGGREELISFLQMAVGYSLTGVTEEECFFFLYGTGANGKTTFIETTQRLMGEYWRKTAAETVLLKKAGGSPITNDVARLAGIRLVSTMELTEGGLLDEARVKDFTGQDSISARFLYSEAFDFRPAFKLWMYGNHEPTIRGVDDGIWRRVRKVPFEVTIPKPERDGRLKDKLAEEVSGILNWAVAGCLRWQREGLPEPAAVREAVEGYRSNMDVVESFLADRCTVKKGETTLRTQPRELHNAYEDWSRENGDEPMNSRTFKRKLESKGYKQDKGTGGKRGWVGIGMNGVAKKAAGPKHAGDYEYLNT